MKNLKQYIQEKLVINNNISSINDIDVLCDNAIKYYGDNYEKCRYCSIDYQIRDDLRDVIKGNYLRIDKIPYADEGETIDTYARMFNKCGEDNVKKFIYHVHGNSMREFCKTIINSKYTRDTIFSVNKFEIFHLRTKKYDILHIGCIEIDKKDYSLGVVYIGKLKKNINEKLVINNNLSKHNDIYNVENDLKEILNMNIKKPNVRCELENFLDFLVLIGKTIKCIIPWTNNKSLINNERNKIVKQLKSNDEIMNAITDKKNAIMCNLNESFIDLDEWDKYVEIVDNVENKICKGNIKSFIVCEIEIVDATMSFYNIYGKYMFIVSQDKKSLATIGYMVLY